MYRFIVLLSALLALAAANTTQVSQCVHHQGALPRNTHIQGCTRPPCALPQLRDAVVNMEFVARKYPYTLKWCRNYVQKTYISD
ncbi:hypothetical protein HF086_011079 [Spodoptera exigua]|uniref:Uncharacterized protein n=1 Tax=Spodoptera exigua TaxID=7107 RepID=A0A922SB85_SPOEX|nr:hypothetical protein HF086_011079 [Spodoptera exigua]